MPSFSTMSLAFELIVLVLVSLEIDGLGRSSAPDQLLFAGSRGSTISIPIGTVEVWP
jgi:hypothetical protein